MDSDVKQYLEDNQHLLDSSNPAQSSTNSEDSNLQQYINDNQHLLDKNAPNSHNPFSTLESTGKGILNGAVAGLGPQAAGLGAGIQQAVLGNVGGTGGRSWDDIVQAYQSMRDTTRNENAQAKAANPLSYGAGELVGSIPSTVAGGTALKAAGVASPLAQGATLGGGSGLTNYLGQNADPTASGALESTAIGAGLGTAGAAVGEGISNALNPDNLEVAGSKLATKAIKMKPSQELTTAYNEDTGQMESGSNIIKGIGKTLMGQGALPMTGGADAIYDNTLQAINKNYQQLAPVLDQTQAKLTPQVQNILADIKPVSLKTADLMQDLTDQIPDTSQKFNLMKKLGDTYATYSQKLDAADGNLAALNEIKRELQSGATDLAKNVYTQGSDASWEATLLKRMGGVVRQHIEDLANGADPGAGDQIHDLNSNIQVLNTALPYIKKLQNSPSVSLGIPDLLAMMSGFKFGPAGFAAEGTKLGTELATGNPIGRLAKIGGARLLNAASDVETPIGTIVQNAPKPVALAATISPWSQEKAQNKAGVTNQSNTSPAQNVTKTASILYNATPQSLDNVADELKRVAGMKYTADRLKQATADNDPGAKNRAIFQILQQPQSRKLVTPGGSK